MNYHTCRDECIILEILLKRMSINDFEKSILDIELHIDRQKAKIESDIRHLENELKDKQSDMECYEWLENKINEMKVGI